MITRRDLLEAIAECQGIRAPNANTAVKLAAFYTILDHLDNAQNEQQSQEASNEQHAYSGYSLDVAPDSVRYDGTSEFARAIDGKQQADIWPVMDELMDTVRVLNERLYNGVMKKLTSR